MRNFLIGFIAAVLMMAANAKPMPAPRNVDAEIAESKALAIAHDMPRANIPSAPRIYTRVGVVYGLEYSEGVVIVQTDDGELWEFINGETTEDWMLDDGCLLTFADTGIPGYMYDDEIWDFRYWNPEDR